MRRHDWRLGCCRLLQGTPEGGGRTSPEGGHGSCCKISHRVTPKALWALALCGSLPKGGAEQEVGGGNGASEPDGEGEAEQRAMAGQVIMMQVQAQMQAV
jgi:hypothetical protein